MPRMSAVKLTKRVVDGLSVERGDRVFYDRDLTGFGVRVYGSGRKIYVVHARAPGAGLRRVALGRHPKLTFEAARRLAVEVIDRLKKGEEAFPEPPAPEPTVADLAERYIEAHLKVNCRPGTVETFGRIVRLYILPEFGPMPLSAVERSHVAALHDRMRDKPYQANQVRDVLAKMFKLAEAWGMAAPRRNPALSIRRYKEYRRERFLSADEYQRLARVLGRGRVRRLGVSAGDTGDSSHSADRMPQERDPDASVGRHRPHGGRDSAERFEDRCASGAVDASGGVAARTDTEDRGQPVDHHGQKSGRPSQEPGHDLAADPAASRAGRRADPRLPPFVRVPRASARRRHSGDQRAARSQEVLDNGALRASCARWRTGVGGEGGRQHRGRHLRMGRG